MSDNEENTETPVSESDEPEKPLEVIVKNQPKDKKWNDSHDDSEHDEIILTKEDMDI